MSKFIMSLAFAALGLLVLLSLLAPHTSAIWLASTSAGYNLIRLILMALLLALLMTNPPRNRYLRYMVGVAAVVISAWSLAATYQNDMKFLDSTSILAASVAMGLVVLEYTPDKNEAADLVS